MMPVTLQPFLQAIYDLPLADAIRENELAFPAIECVHVLAVCLVVGFVTVVDLRLLGLPAHKRSVIALHREMLPLVWIAFVCAAVSGALLFISNATGYAKNFDFQVKMALLVLAFFNMVVFHVVGQRRISEWHEHPATPKIAKLFGALSLLLWIGVVIFGREIGFTLAPF
jgi:hypothetical protein